jgi:hypothetical protein
MPNADAVNRVIAFRASLVLANATEAAAALDLCSLSDIARRALARDLRRRGLLAGRVETEARGADSLVRAMSR